MTLTSTRTTFEDLPKPEFVVKDKSIEKLSKKIKPNTNLERL